VRVTEINRNTANRLHHESTSSIDFEKLEKLCDYLECDVGSCWKQLSDESMGKNTNTWKCILPMQESSNSSGGLSVTGCNYGYSTKNQTLGKCF
jgi:hypothetical protein